MNWTMLLLSIINMQKRKLSYAFRQLGIQHYTNIAYGLVFNAFMVVSFPSILNLKSPIHCN